MEDWILPGERAEDLEYQGLWILSAPGCQGVCTDSVLLADFVRAGARDRLVDLGCGTGVLSLLVAKRTGAFVTGIELMEKPADMARRAALHNSQERVRILVMDLAAAPERLGHGSFTAAMANPPYFTAGERSQSPERAAARHEGATSLEAVVKSAAGLLGTGGRFFCCYPAQGMVELACLLRQAGMEPKRLRTVAARQGCAPRLLLVEARKGGKPGLVWMDPLIVYGEDGAFTPEILRIYHKTEEKP